MPEDDATSASASVVFAEYVGRLEAGEAAHFEALCERHPSLADELRSLERHWRVLSEVFDQLSFNRSLSKRLSERLGTGIDPGISLAPEGEKVPADGFTTEMLGRLEGRLASFGRYRVLSEVDHGGQGVVLRVWDEDLRRKLAMKVAMPRSGQGDLDSLGRFLEEAQVTSQLDHPGIVPVHELGLDSQGRVYFTMKLVDGRDLRAIFGLVAERREGWTLTRAVNALLRVCEAMAYAHSKSVVHRDLKPANVMVGRFGEVFVMDWGLARILGREDRHDMRIKGSGSSVLTSPRREAKDEDSGSPLVTEDGQVLGTPAYMSPEQAQGRIDQIGPRTDVYSVGAILYSLLAGRAPYERPGRHVGAYAVLYQLQNGPPASVAKLAPQAPPALVAICEKAMARDREQRYASMEDLAEDLRAYLEGRVVRAFEGGLAAELRRWIGRNRALSTSIAAALLLALAGLLGIALVRARAESRAALQAYADDLALTGYTLELGDTAEARRILEACRPDLRGWEWRHLAFRCDTSVSVLRGHEGPVSDACVSGDGRLVASASQDGTARLWDAGDGRALAVLPHTVPVHAVAFDGAGRVLTGAEDRRIRAWNEDGSLHWTSDELDAPVQSIAVDSEGLIATGLRDGDLLLWKDGRSSHLLDLESNLDAVFGLVFTRRQELLAGTRHDIQVWDLATGSIARYIPRMGSAFALSPMGRLACTVPMGNAIDLVDLMTGELVGQWDDKTAVLALAFDPEGLRLASGSADETLKLRDVHSGSVLSVLRGHQGTVECVAYAPDGTWLVSGSRDGTLRIWDSATQATSTDFVFTDFPVAALAFTPGSDRLVACLTSCELLVLDAVSGKVLSRSDNFLDIKAFLADPYAKTQELATTPVAIGSGATWVAAFREDGTLERRDVESLATSSLPLELRSATALAVAADGQWLAAGSESGVVLQSVSDTGGRRVLATEVPVTAVAFPPDGRRVAAGLEDGSVRFWSLSSGDRLEDWKGQASAVWSLAFDDQGSRAATGTDDGKIRIWEVRGGRSLLELPGTDRTTALAFSPDGRRLVSGTHSGSVKDRTVALAFSPDGRRLVSGTRSGLVRVWESDVSDARGLWRAPRVLRTQYESLREGARAADHEAAQGLVDQLFQRHLEVKAVVEALQAYEGIADDLRYLAIQIARERGDLTPSDLESIALRIVIDPYLSPEGYERARKALEGLLELHPDRGSARFLLGAAYYRLGQAALAQQHLEAAARAIAEGSETPGDAVAAGFCFLALSCADLGRTSEADEALAHAKEAAGPATTPEMRQLLREAQSRLR